MTYTERLEELKKGLFEIDGISLGIAEHLADETVLPLAERWGEEARSCVAHVERLQKERGNRFKLNDAQQELVDQLVRDAEPQLLKFMRDKYSLVVDRAVREQRLADDEQLLYGAGEVEPGGIIGEELPRWTLPAVVRPLWRLTTEELPGWFRAMLWYALGFVTPLGVAAWFGS